MFVVRHLHVQKTIFNLRDFEMQSLMTSLKSLFVLTSKLMEW